MITTTTRDEGLLRYINLKLAALAQPTSRSTADPYFLEIAGPLLRNHYQKDQLLGDRLCPVDARIQTFLDAYLAAACPAGAPRLPANTFVLDRPGLARAMSLPPESDSFSSPYLHSYRVPQGVLHNPKNDRRTTQGVFHIVEGGLPIPADKGQAALKVSHTLPGAGDLALTLAVEPRSNQCREPIRCGLLELLSPVRHAASFLAAQLAGLCTGDIRIRPGLAGGPGRALAEIAVVACFLLFHQAVVVDHQRAGGQVVAAGAVAADEQRLEPLRGLDVQVMSRLVPDRPARDLAAAEQVGTHPSTLLTRPAFPVLFPVLAPEKPPDAEPPPRVGI